MKKLILLILVLVVGTGLIADDVKKGSLWNITVSPGVLYGGAVGYGKYSITDEKTCETFICLHHHTAEESTCRNFLNEYIPIQSDETDQKNTGLYIQYNRFWQKHKYRSGFFTLGKFGVSYHSYLHREFNLDIFNPSGSSEPEIRKEFFPHLSGGCGYSFSLPCNMFFRLSLDVGLKIDIANLNFSFVF